MTAPPIHAIDHVVPTVRDPAAAAAFYARALGIGNVTFAGGRVALRIGAQKITLRTLGREIHNHAGDLCLLTDRPLDEIAARLEGEGIAILEGPVAKTGARGPITSLCFTDPDGNLIEIATHG